MEIQNNLSNLKKISLHSVTQFAANNFTFLNATFNKQKETHNTVHWMNKFLTSKQKVLLLIGETGSGKTTTCMQFIKSVKENIKLSNIVCFYLDLNQMAITNNNLLETFLINKNFTSDEINRLKTNPNIIFIIDGYERLGSYKNLYIQHHMNEWQAKVIFTCSSQYFLQNDDFAVYFQPIQHGKVCVDLLSIITLEPLNKDQIKDVCVLHQTAFDHETLTNFGLSELATNPLMLQMILEIFPKHHKSNKDKIFIQKTVYAELLTAWFRHYENKLKDSKQLDKNDDNFIATCWQYCQALAKIMQTKNLTTIVYEAVSTLFGKEETEETEETNEWHLFFTSKKQNLHLVRSIVPIRTIQPQHYAFYSNELVTYFANYKLNQSLALAAYKKAEKKSATKPAAKKILSAIPSNNIPSYLLNHYLNQHLIVTDSNLIQLFVDKVRASKQFENFLFNLLYASASDGAMATAGANAITILNAAKVSFSWLKLHNVRIRHAILDYGNFEGTELIGADMEGVSCKNIYMPYAKLDDANMAGVIFGETASLKFDIKLDDFLSCSCSSDGRLLAAGTYETIIIYDLLNEKIKFQLPSVNDLHNGYVDFHPNSKFLAAISDKTSITIWDMSTGNSVKKFSQHTNTINVVKYNKAGNYLATGNGSGEIFIWETYDYTCVLKINNHHEHVYDLDFDSTGQYLASADSSGIIKIWNLLTGRCIKCFTDGCFESVFTKKTVPALSVCFSPNNQLIASTNSIGDIFIRHINSEYIKMIETDNETVNKVIFSQDSQHLVAANSDNTISIWSLQDYTCVNTLRGHTDPVNFITFSHDQRYIISGGMDSTIRFWSFEAYLTNSLYEKNENKEITNFYFSANGQYLATAEVDGFLGVDDINNAVVRLWNANTGKCLYVWEQASNCLIFSQNSRYIAWANNDITIRDLFTGETVEIEGAIEDGIKSICFSPHTNYIVSGSNTANVILWDINTAQPVRKFTGPTQTVHSVCFNRNSNLLACATGNMSAKTEDKDNSVYIWNAVTGEKIQCLKVHKLPVVKVAFSHSSKTLASLSEDESIKIWDVNNGKCLVSLSINEGLSVGAVGSLNKYNRILYFSPDDKYLIAGEGLYPLRIWSTKTYQLINTIDFGVTSAYAFNFSTTGKVQCASTNAGDHSIKVWQPVTENFIDTEWQLLWTSLPILSLKKCSIKNINNISEQNYKLLKQHKATGKAANIISSTQDKKTYSEIISKNTTPTAYSINLQMPLAELLIALEKTEGNLSADIKLAKIYTDLGYVCFLRKIYSDAIKYFLDADNLLKDRSNASSEKLYNYFYLGQAYFEAKNYQAAINYFKLSLDFFNKIINTLAKNDELKTRLIKRHYQLDKAQCLYSLGLSYLAENNSELTASYLIDAYKLYSVCQQKYQPKIKAIDEIKFLLTKMGNDLYLQNETEKAKDYFMPLNLDIQTVESQREYAIKAYEHEQLTNAIQHYEIILKLGSTNINDYLYLGRACHIQALKQNDKTLLDKCHSYLQTGMNLATDENTVLLLEYALCLCQQQNYADAITYLETAIINNNSDLPSLNYTYLEAVILPNDLANEVQEYKEITIQPCILAYYLLVLSYVNLTDLTAATYKVEAFQQLVTKDLHPEALHWSLLGYCYRSLNQFHKAMDCFTKAAQLQTNSILALTNREQCFNQIKLPGEILKPVELPELPSITLQEKRRLAEETQFIEHIYPTGIPFFNSAPETEPVIADADFLNADYSDEDNFYASSNSDISDASDISYLDEEEQMKKALEESARETEPDITKPTM